ncbi:MAG: protein kinase domain-containing protein [Actinomycetota bacterium]
MNYCINPDCKQRQNPDGLECCQTCGTPLLINGRYRLLQPLRPINPRNSTDVFEVEDGESRKVMKILKDSNPQLIEFFEREALTLQSLNHPGIPKVEIDSYFTVLLPDSDQELYCLVMEKIEGKNLEQWVAERGTLTQSVALVWLKQLLEILNVIHQNRFFHRDIKPSNIMVKPDGQLALIDFGTARGITGTYFLKFRGGNATTVVSGGYTPPEQIDGRATPQSDFYALGRTFVYLLTGRHPSELPKDPKTGKLMWCNKSLKLSNIFAVLIDELMAERPEDRPLNAAGFLQYLTPQGMLLKSLLDVIFSQLTKRLLVVGVTGSVIYRLSFPIIAQQLYEAGVKELKANQLETAKLYYEKALEFNSKDARIYNDLGYICQKLQSFDCAERYYNFSLYLNPANSVARYNLGGLYDDLGNQKRAEIEYQSVFQSDSVVAVDAASALARMKILQRDSAGAIRVALLGLPKTNHPKVQSALYKNLGWARFMQTEYIEAEINLRQAIKLNPERTDAYCLLAQVLEAKREASAALASWKDCLRGDAKNQVEIKTWQTIAIQRLKDAGET